MASTASCLQLHKRAERVAAALMGRLNTGDHVALVYPPGTPHCCSEKIFFLPPNVLNVISMFGRCRPDRHLLRLPVRRLRAGHSQTATPSEPGNHSAHRQDDRGGSFLCSVGECVYKSSQCVDDFSFFFFSPSLQVSKSVCILTSQTIMKLLKSKEAAAAVDIKSWPMVLDTGEVPSKRGATPSAGSTSGF